MTTSERLLTKIALRLAVLVAFTLLGYLPDRRERPLLAHAPAAEMSAAWPQGLQFADRRAVTVGYAGLTD